MVSPELKTIDVSLAQEMLRVYDQHCQKVIESKNAEIRELKARIAQLEFWRDNPAGALVSGATMAARQGGV